MLVSVSMTISSLAYILLFHCEAQLCETYAVSIHKKKKKNHDFKTALTECNAIYGRNTCMHVCFVGITHIWSSRNGFTLQQNDFGLGFGNFVCPTTVVYSCVYSFSEIFCWRKRKLSRNLNNIRCYVRVIIAQHKYCPTVIYFEIRHT